MTFTVIQFALALLAGIAALGYFCKYTCALGVSADCAQ